MNRFGLKSKSKVEGRPKGLPRRRAMGVRGLNSFVERNPDLREGHRLHDSHLVIDGSSLQYHLYGMSSRDVQDCHYGGNFVSYARLIRKFFHSLFECNIRPVVVLDGGLDISEAKLKTVVDRQVNRLRTLRLISHNGPQREVMIPVLCTKVFKDVLVEMKIPLVQSIYEADTDVAMIANHYKCPVLSNDSDFFVFDLLEGYISIDSLDFKSIKTFAGLKDQESDSKSTEGLSRRYLDCLRYHIDKLLVYFPGLERSMLPLFSSLMGNDYVGQKVFDGVFSVLPKKEGKRRSGSLSFGKNHERMITLLNWMRGKTVEDATQFLVKYLKTEKRNAASDLIALTLSNYAQASQSSCLLRFVEAEEASCQRTCDCSHHVVYTQDKQEIPEWFAQQFNRAVFDRQLMDLVSMKRTFLSPQIDDFLLPSSYSCSQRLQRYLFGLLRLRSEDRTPVTAFDRTEGNLQKFTLNLEVSLEDGTSLPCLRDIPCLTEDERREIVMSVLETSAASVDKLHANLEGHVLDQETAAQFTHMLLLVHFTFRQPNALVCLEFALSLVTCILYYSIISAPKSHKVFDIKEKKAAKSSLIRFTVKPKHNNGDPFRPRLVHMFSQLQGVILIASQINTLLGFPLSKLRVDKILDGTFCYNLTHELCVRPNPSLYCKQLLGRNSSLALLSDCMVSVLVDEKELPRFKKGNPKKSKPPKRMGKINRVQVNDSSRFNLLADNEQ